MKADQDDAQKLLTWLREPDYAEEFSLAQAIDWMNRRPIAEAERLLARATITKGIMSVPIVEAR